MRGERAGILSAGRGTSLLGRGTLVESADGKGKGCARWEDLGLFMASERVMSLDGIFSTCTTYGVSMCRRTNFTDIGPWGERTVGSTTLVTPPYLHMANVCDLELKNRGALCVGLALPVFSSTSCPRSHACALAFSRPVSPWRSDLHAVHVNPQNPFPQVLKVNPRTGRWMSKSCSDLPKSRDAFSRRRER